MNVLVIGSGGREHALVWALHRSPSVSKVWAAPGNPGMASDATVLATDVTDHAAVIATVEEHEIDLVVIGPEAPLIAGLADDLRAANIAVFGPSKAAAMLEGSKTFAKTIMEAAKVNTARYWSGNDPDQVIAALSDFDEQVVIKADGLAAGKGVFLCDTHDQAVEAINHIMRDQAFGAAGNRIVIEEMMTGPECSLFGISDGTTVLPMQSAQDFKRIGEHDEGLNTGGMGAYSPVPAVDAAVAQDLRKTVLQPVIDEMAKRGTPFVGVLYAGLMLTPAGPRVVEFNARFGDPETQIVLPLLTTDLGLVLYKAATGALHEIPKLEFRSGCGVTVVVASQGYPGEYETGIPITGLPENAADRQAGQGQPTVEQHAEAQTTAPSTPEEDMPTVTIFHAGTKLDANGQLVSAGGRVLAVSSTAPTYEAARAQAYATIDAIDFANAYVRRDIAANPSY